MKTPNQIQRFSQIFAAALLATTQISGAALMLDFGPTPVSSKQAINSPYHAINSAFTDTFWNQIETKPLTNTVVISNGSVAPSITVKTGRSSSLDKNILTFSGAPASATLGTQTNRGKFTPAAVGRDGIYFDDKVGVVISGIAEGTYEVYVVGINTNKSAESEARIAFWAISHTDTSKLDTSKYLGAPQAISRNSTATTWKEHENYVKLTVTLSVAQPELVVFATGLSSSEQRGFLNSIQILPVQ